MLTGFIQKVKYCFSGLSRTCKHKIPGFSRTHKTGFHGLSRIHLVYKHGCMRSEKCTYQISYQCSCITANKPKLSEIQIDPRDDKLHATFYDEFLPS